MLSINQLEDYNWPKSLENYQMESGLLVEKEKKVNKKLGFNLKI